MMQSSKTRRFWDDFYETEKEAEWIVAPSEELMAKIVALLQTPTSGVSQILEIGCGSSRFAQELATYLTRRCVPHHILSTDVSPVCIEQQRESVRLPHLSYAVADVTEGPAFPDCSFDLILDKACLDTILFRTRHRRTGPNELVSLVLGNLDRWLKPNGVYLSISPRRKMKELRDFEHWAYEKELLKTKEEGGRIESGTATREGSRTVYLHISRKGGSRVHR